MSENRQDVPLRSWQPDVNGRCQRICPQWGKQAIQERDYWGCVLLDRLAWEVFDQPTPDKLSPCPFHVLSAILGLPLPGGAR